MLNLILLFAVTVLMKSENREKKIQIKHEIEELKSELNFFEGSVKLMDKIGFDKRRKQCEKVAERIRNKITKLEAMIDS